VNPTDVKQFALIGAAGYVAPRHLRAIADTGNNLACALDVHDSVGILDAHFPGAQFFTEFERFDRHIDKRRRSGDGAEIDYVAVCSPNYLHDAHVRFALRSGADAICEKPLVLNPWNIDGLQELEQESGRRVSTILQLRLHPAIMALRERYAGLHSGHKVDVDLTYITSRGSWYLHSWKGDERKSGGIATNIGIHLFDMLAFVFGDLQTSVVHHRSPTCNAGYLELQNARVRWFLSIDAGHLPEAARAAGQRTFRSINCDGSEVEFSQGFTDLHTESYRGILRGEGFGLDEARRAVECVAEIRECPITRHGEAHPMLAALD
jgi:UDP-N-acetyl-2-amino-2-deoxyglucuronate dehydrogenase